MRFERSRAACTRCCFAEPAGRGTGPGTVAACVPEAALDECRSWLSFVDRTAREDASSDDRREPGWLIPRTQKQDSLFARPPGGRRVGSRDFSRPQRDKIDTLVGVASNQRAVFAVHVPFQLVNGRRLRPAHSVRPSDGCRSRGSGPQDKDIGRLMRRPASAMVVQVLCIQAPRWFQASHANRPASGRLLSASRYGLRSEPHAPAADRGC
jgi:hypothetical protein